MFDDDEDEDRAQRVARVTREARATVERVTAAEEERREEFERLPPLERAKRLIGAPDDPGMKWRAEMEAITAERERARDAIAAMKPALPDWDAIDARIAEALAVERRLVAEAIGAATGRLLTEERKDMMREIAELRTHFAADRDRTVVDLPRLPLRNVN